MKLCRIIAFVGALAASTIPNVLAAAPLKVQVPFAFIVGNRTMPAGEYTVDSSTNGSTIFYIHGPGSGLAVLSSPAVAATAASSQRPGLIFKTRGSQRYLVDVQMTGEPGRFISEPGFTQSSLTAVR